MASKEKLYGQLKNLFRMNKGNYSGTIRSGDDYVLSEEIQRDLSKDSPLQVRTKAIKELNQQLTSYRFSETCIPKVWGYIEELLKDPTDLSHLGFQCLQSLIYGQGRKLHMLRAQIFKVISEYKHDVGIRFDLLITLTENGKDIEHFEEKMAPFLLEWFPDVIKAGKTNEFLLLLTNLIKFHSARISEDVIVGFVNHICLLCSNSIDYKQIILPCIDIFDSIVAYYRNLPSDSLSNFVGVLCRMVTIESYCQICWKIMKNLLGTHMGHSAIFTMCRILQEHLFKDDPSLLRGALIFIYMGLWDQPLPNLRCPPTSILPSILQVVDSNYPIVIYEVLISMEKLVFKYSMELQDSSWDLIIKILSVIVKRMQDMKTSSKNDNEELEERLHKLLNSIENLIKCSSFNGNINQFYNLIQDCSAIRPDTSVIGLISYLAQEITPNKPMWIIKLNTLMNNYYKYENERRTTIRLKVLEVVSYIVQLNKMLYEEELIDRIILPHLNNLQMVKDEKIRSAGAGILIDLCLTCESKRCFELLDVLEKLLNRPYSIYTNHAASQADTVDVERVVAGLVKILAVKIHKLPSLHAVTVYNILVGHLEMHYSRPKIFECCKNVRIAIFNCFMNMRADHLYRIGYPDTNGFVKYSSYICVTYRSSDKGSFGSPPPPPSPSPQQPQLQCVVTNVSVRGGFKALIQCLKQEQDWEVLTAVLKQIPKVLQNKTFVLTKHGNTDIGLLVKNIILIINNYKSTPESQNTKSRSDFYYLVLTILHGLVNYHSNLDAHHQSSIIYQFCALKLGPGPCIFALTTCILEMQDCMVKVANKVLLTLSQSSATVHIAVPVLEFLSTLSILPNVYANFAPEQYMTIFATLLAYTNPFKYNHYIVSLAHRIIAVWFLKCPLPYRKEFARYICNSLQNNELVKQNEDSSDRKRSSSLTEQRSSHRERASTVVGRMDSKTNLEFRPVLLDKTLVPFYTELTDTCIELLSRYTFLPCSALPRRLPVAEFLLSGGQSMSWLLGNRIITVTTSGCSQKVLKNGLCDKCLAICKVEEQKSPEKMAGILKTTLQSRSGSHDKDESNSTRVTRQNSGSNNNTTASSPIEESKRFNDRLEQLPGKLQQLATDGCSSKLDKHRCVCWCQGWAEIHIRRPTGDTSWIMRIQNQTSHQTNIYEFPLNEISGLLKPSLRGIAESEHACNRQISSEDDSSSHRQSSTEDGPSTSTTMPISIPGSPNKQSPSRQSSRDSMEADADVETIFYDEGGRSRNPVRRSNSSPEMSTNWKNPFLMQKAVDREDGRSQDPDECIKKPCGSSGVKNNFPKDMRVSCEAIPEEIAGMGTTPPSNDTMTTVPAPTTHPGLLSSLSYPGITEGGGPNATKSYQSGPSGTQNSGKLKACRSESIDGTVSDNRPSNLQILLPLSSKPPQGPTQTSPRLSRHNLKEREAHEIQKSSSLILEGTQIQKKDKKSNEANLNDYQRRDRGYTISVMQSPGHKANRPSIGMKNRENARSGINPSFVFLQLYHSAHFGSTNEKPLLIDSGVVQRSLKVLDCIPPYEMHKIGVIYIGVGQNGKEVDILKNKYGSVRYVQFLKNLGTLIKIQDVDPQLFFLGGLEQNGSDGKYAYIWQDGVIRVMFHVATIMPNKDSDVNCTNKKKHIGNDNVTIVYNDSGEDYNINTIKGQFNFANVIIQPLDQNTNRVTVKVKEELSNLIGNTETRIVSDQNVAILSRQLALNTNLASLVFINKSKQVPYASVWVERLRQIKNIRKKIIDSKNESANQTDQEFKSRNGRTEDFTDYT
ncbi:PREDICTED: tuberin [Nicrophorus vespilloides]|uniref:Tuberin n=1 Tax=Nicrophorus vespilloides TaxID=110193 RepID=A0ABM1M773_NICVS|nr:PREDICTED: tuberin [Nicrophorus vespilloides]